MVLIESNFWPSLLLLETKTMGRTIDGLRRRLALCLNFCGSGYTFSCVFCLSTPQKKTFVRINGNIMVAAHHRDKSMPLVRRQSDYMFRRCTHPHTHLCATKS